jgi:hypothetical protein
MSPHPYLLVVQTVTLVAFLLVTVTYWRRGDRRHGQMFAYLTLSQALWLLYRLLPGMPEWLFYLGAAVWMTGSIIYYTRVHSLLDWRREEAAGKRSGVPGRQPEA